jgi:RNA polymerase sigma-32 factor
MKAIKRFDPSKGVRLFSFAIHWIKAEIHEFILRNWKIVKVATTKAHRKLFFNLRSLKRKLNLDNNLKNEDIGIIANELNVEYSDVVEMDKRLSCSDSPLESDGEGSSIIDFLEANNADPAEILADQQSSSIRKKLLMKAFKELDERSQTILKSRWLNVKEGKKAKTLKELASEFGISAERVRQLEVTAFGNLRKKITLDERDMSEKYAGTWKVGIEDGRSEFYKSLSSSLPENLQSKKNNLDGIWLVDPRGAFMMKFPISPDIRKVYKDLSRLLKVSRVG